MIHFPNAKINIGLNIVEKRPDGYHNLESIFYPIPLYDALEITESDSFEFIQSGIIASSNAHDNIVVKVYQLMCEEHRIPPIKINLHKSIPLGAGMGGGSADAAFFASMLNERFLLGLSASELMVLVGKIGADCPFFIKNSPTYVTGTGDIFESSSLSLKGYHILLVKPDLHLSTKEAFARIVPHQSDKSLAGLVNRPIVKWKELIKNDFEASLFPLYPLLERIKSDLYRAGALYASMSGSGSTLYGIFTEQPDATLFIQQNYWTKNLFIE